MCENSDTPHSSRKMRSPWMKSGGRYHLGKKIRTRLKDRLCGIASRIAYPCCLCNSMPNRAQTCSCRRSRWARKVPSVTLYHRDLSILPLEQSIMWSCCHTRLHFSKESLLTFHPRRSSTIPNSSLILTLQIYNNLKGSVMCPLRVYF